MHTTPRAVLLMAAFTLCALPASAQHLDLTAGIALPHYQYDDNIGIGYTIGGGISWDLSRTISIGGLGDIYVRPADGWTRTHVVETKTWYQGQDVMRYDTVTSSSPDGAIVVTALGARLSWAPFGRTGTVSPYLTVDAMIATGFSTKEATVTETRSSIPQYSTISALPGWLGGGLGGMWGPGLGVLVNFSDEVQGVAEMRYYGVMHDGIIPIRAGVRLGL